MAITFFDKNSGTDKIVKFNANKHSEISLVNLNSPRGLFQLLVEKHNGDQKVLGKFRREITDGSKPKIGVNQYALETKIGEKSEFYVFKALTDLQKIYVKKNLIDTAHTFSHDGGHV